MDGASAVDTPVCYFAQLPQAFLLLILALLPVDTRLRCAEVCRDWRAALAERSLWLRLALSPESGVRFVTDKLLGAAAARAGGGLLSLSVSSCSYISPEALVAVAMANAATLQEARLCLGEHWELRCVQLEALLRGTPLLRTLHADVRCTAADARRLLRNEPPFEALRMRRFLVVAALAAGGEGAALALAADLPTHASLEELRIVGAPLDAPAALDAVVQAALACLLLRRLDLVLCSLSRASAPALARLLGGGALTALHIHGDAQLLDEPAAVLLGNALRANTTLTSLVVRATRLWQEPAAGVALLNALTGHPSLCKLDISYDPVGAAAQQQAGTALGALVAANAPTLRGIYINESGMGDAGMGPVVDALPRNTHLRFLSCLRNGMSDAFVRERLLPVVRPDLICTHK